MTSSQQSGKQTNIGDCLNKFTHKKVTLFKLTAWELQIQRFHHFPTELELEWEGRCSHNHFRLSFGRLSVQIHIGCQLSWWYSLDFHSNSVLMAICTRILGQLLQTTVHVITFCFQKFNSLCMSHMILVWIAGTVSGTVPAFSNKTQCNMLDYFRRFEGSCFLNFQSRTILMTEAAHTSQTTVNIYHTIRHQVR